MQMSADGLFHLQRYEGLRLYYYNDVALNCTYGIGTLAHIGPCTPEEDHRPVSRDVAMIELHKAVAGAERVVRAAVTRTALTQAQFDSLVSCVYNLGAGGARKLLERANEGDHAATARHIREHIWIHPRDKQGRKLQPKISRGLVNRRAEEARPFEEPRR